MKEEMIMMKRGFSLYLSILICCFLQGTAWSIQSVTAVGGDMQRTIALGMSKQELTATVGAPDIVKSDGACLYYEVFDLSVMLNSDMKIYQLYLGKNFSGTVKKQDGSEASLTDVFKEFGEPLSTERLAYMPSTAIAAKSTIENENEVSPVAGRQASFPMEYRGHRKLYELFGKGMIMKYKYVLDDEGIAFWFDNEKELYATVIYPPKTAPVEAKKTERAGAIECDIVLFDFDKDILTEDAQRKLAACASLVNDNETVSLMIDGHTDAMGTDEYNQDLSERRAKSVYNYFVSRGITPVQLKMAGHGEQEPVAPNETPDGRDNPEGRAQNRRVKCRLLYGNDTGPTE